MAKDKSKKDKAKKAESTPEPAGLAAEPVEPAAQPAAAAPEDTYAYAADEAHAPATAYAEPAHTGTPYAETPVAAAPAHRDHSVIVAATAGVLGTLLLLGLVFGIGGIARRAVAGRAEFGRGSQMMQRFDGQQGFGRGIMRGQGGQYGYGDGQGGYGSGSCPGLQGGTQGQGNTTVPNQQLPPSHPQVPGFTQ